MSEVKVNKITQTAACGTVTLGDSGDTLSIPCGVTLSNAGSITNSGTITNTGTISGGTITGTIDNQVNWDTTAKTAGFTAVAGNGYFVNTTSGAITVTLPASPSAGDLVGIKDYANTADTNAITIARNGENIQGTANDFTISTEGLSILLIYVDGTQGWVSTGAAKASDIAEQALFITATGGCVSCCGDYKIHTFTGPGTFTVTCAGNPLGSTTVDYLVVAGGGAGGGGSGGSGAGAGGYRESSGAASGCYSASPLGACVSALPVTATGYPITVGAGGTGVNAGGTAAPPGSDSTFSTITSAGGARGVGEQNNGSTGGSGGGAGHHGGAGVPYSGGAGNTPPVAPPQGQSGGGSSPCGPTNRKAGGGGGAGATGSTSPTGNGGNGVTSSITASPVTRAGGGGGGGESASPGNLPRQGSGGSGGGGNSGPVSGGVGANGTANTGSGGGGSVRAPQPATTTYAGGNGGGGIVIIRYKYQ